MVIPTFSLPKPSCVTAVSAVAAPPSDWSALPTSAEGLPFAASATFELLPPGIFAASVDEAGFAHCAVPEFSFDVFLPGLLFVSDEAPQPEIAVRRASRSNGVSVFLGFCIYCPRFSVRKH